MLASIAVIAGRGIGRAGAGGGGGGGRARTGQTEVSRGARRGGGARGKLSRE